MLDELLHEVKQELKITWDDEDVMLSNMIERGKGCFNSLVGVELDFSKNNQAKSLLLNYCRYDYNSALEYFETNFSKEIIRLQLQEAVSKHADEEG